MVKRLKVKKNLKTNQNLKKIWKKNVTQIRHPNFVTQIRHPNSSPKIITQICQPKLKRRKIHKNVFLCLRKHFLRTHGPYVNISKHSADHLPTHNCKCNLWKLPRRTTGIRTFHFDDKCIILLFSVLPIVRVKFIYSEKATKFCEIFTLLLSIEYISAVRIVKRMQVLLFSGIITFFSTLINYESSDLVIIYRGHP